LAVIKFFSKIVLMVSKIIILGVTASGKSRLGFDLAKAVGAQIVSVDSMKVYRHMDIGTAKPSIQKQIEVKHHLINVVDPSESFSVGMYLDLAHEAYAKIQADNCPIIAAGGTPMYIKAMLFGLFNGPPADETIRQRLKDQINAEGNAPLYRKLQEVDPAAADRIHLNDERRIVRALEVYELTGKPISSFQTQFDAPRPVDDWFVIGLRRPKEVESQRINARVKKMVEMGLVDEVKSLLERFELSKQAAAAIGYAEIIEHLEGKINLDKAIENIKVNTRKLAKSQRTWFKTFKQVNWIDSEEHTTPEQILDKAIKLL
jgi:tRNA dimethylallyltransferase